VYAYGYLNDYTAVRSDTVSGACRFEMKHSKQLEESRAVSLAAVKELEQLQVPYVFAAIRINLMLLKIEIKVFST
jgi:hypothetical protein